MALALAFFCESMQAFRHHPFAALCWRWSFPVDHEEAIASSVEEQMTLSTFNTSSLINRLRLPFNSRNLSVLLFWHGSCIYGRQTAVNTAT